MKEKLFKFLVGTKFGLLLIINAFVIVGLFAATPDAPFINFLGGLIWFASNALVMAFAYTAKIPTAVPGGGGGHVYDPPVDGGGGDNTVIIDQPKEEK